jgi:eukaryotic-like serine/threonine-protein kinase
MAPELVRGEPATIASDVFAFATAIAEALGCPPGKCIEERDRRLRDRGASLQLRSAVTAGLAVDPDARCSLDVLIASLEDRRWRWRRWLAPALVLAVAAIMLAIGSETRASSCELTPSTWTAARRTQLVSNLASTGAALSTLQRIVALVDDKDRDITRVISASCNARRGGQLTAEQSLIRQSCLARRRFELTSAVDQTLFTRTPIEAARARLLGIAEADVCLTITPAPLPVDHLVVRRLYARYVASRDLRAEAGEQELAAVEQAALRVGERELAARAALSLARRYNARDQLADAEDAAQRAHRVAMEIQAVELAAGALVERSRVASQRGDGKSARSFAQLARDLIDRPTTTKRAAARVYAALGRAHNDLGEYKIAIDELQRGIAIVEAMPEPTMDVELPLRIMYVHTLATWQHDQHAVDVARETVARVKQLVGDRDPNYAVALNMLAYALRSNSDLEHALPIRRHALAVLLATMPADDSHVMMQRADLADDLVTLGEFEQARQDYRRVLAASELNQTIKGNRVKVLPAYAIATFHSGRIAAGLHLQEQAYEESLVQFGPDHPWTLSVLWTGIELALEVRDVARAQRMLGLLHAGYRKRPEDALWAAVARGVLDADVAMLQHKPHLAENLAREALVRCGELNAGDAQLVDVYFALGQSLRLQRKLPEAREALETAQRLADKAQLRADAVAWIDIELASVDVAQGYPAAAYVRASRARDVLERFPGRLRARAQADAVIAKSRGS